MKHQIIIILMGIFTSLFGCGQNNNAESDKIFPEDNFSVVRATYNDGTVAIGSFNQAYKNYDKKSKYPWCLKISIGLKLENCKENGLPEEEENIIANELEDELLAKIKSLTTGHYVGHLFNDTFLDIYVYLDDPEKVHEWLQTQTNKDDLIRGFGYEINKDKKWKTITSFMNE